MSTEREKVDVLAVMRNPSGFVNFWTTGTVAALLRLRGVNVSTSRVLTALRREQKAGNVVCLGHVEDDGGWHGNNITANNEFKWRLACGCHQICKCSHEGQS